MKLTKKYNLKKHISIVFLTLLSVFLSRNLHAQFVTHHNAIFQPEISIPQAGINITDPKFGTHLKRVTNARVAGKAGCFPDYSKRQAWNSDQTSLMLRSANGSVDIYNGQTYQYEKSLVEIEGVQDIFWHPANPKIIYYILNNTFNTINVQSLQTNLLFTFSNYSYVSTRAEGNISNDGHYIALCGYDSIFNPIDFFVFNIFSNSIFSVFPLSGKVSEFDWISISPLGNYVIVDYANDIAAPYNGLEVYNNNFNFIWRKPLGAGHSDCGLDANGNEVLIMDVYDGDSNITYINKYLLMNGTKTKLLSVSPDFDLHESCRAMLRPGWVYISTFDFIGRLIDDSLSWLPFEDEIFALKMDGSGDVQRYAHHHSKRYSVITPNSDSSVYFAEPHATVNKTGTYILFGSNWRYKVEQDSSVDAYLIDLSNVLSIGNITNNCAKTELFNLVPNPVIDELKFNTNLTIWEINVHVYNTQGILVKIFSLNQDMNTIHLSDLSKGLYFYQIFDQELNQSGSGKFIKE
ncbi:MAG: T9SS type A sorting domain-containing protein [Bacteroidota bacterium]|nr:T9SS type A sorting domain-containing protein [Bacteroidota bacterium]